MNPIRKVSQFVIIMSLGAGLILSDVPAFGANVTVLVGSGGFIFTPATANIAVNDSVIWSWSGTTHHSTTSGTSTGGVGTPNGLWNSGVTTAPFSFTNTFQSAGTFPYYCSVHVSFGMVGSIIVSNSAVPPTVTITNPASGAVFAAPASFNLIATAADSGGNVTNVQFLQGSVSLGNITSAPFSLAVNNLSAATYTFSAVATANNGLKATNSIPLNVVNPSPLSLSAPAKPAPGQFQFSYASDVGLTYLVQLSTNPTSSWLSIATNTAVANPTLFIDAHANQPDSFYRVIRLPNP